MYTMVGGQNFTGVTNLNSLGLAYYINPMTGAYQILATSPSSNSSIGTINYNSKLTFIANYNKFEKQ